MIDFDKQRLIRFLWDHGYFWNPAKPEGFNVGLADLAVLVPEDRVVVEAISGWQAIDAQFDVLSFIFNLRAVIADGGIGRTTIAMLDSPRCPLPDFAPPPGAAFHYDEQHLQRAVEKMQAATGQGSWPHGCYGTNGVHEIKVSYDPSKLSAKQKEWLPAIKLHNATQVAAMGLKLIEVPVGETSNVDFFGRSYSGNIIGMAEFNGESCGDNCFCTISPNYDPNFRMTLLLAMHEFGHTMNFEHSSNFLMNPSIMDVPEYWVQRNASGVITYQDVRYAKGKQFFGGDSLTPTTPVPPVPTPGDENGVYIFEGRIFKIKVWPA